MHPFLPRESRERPSALPAVHLSSPASSSPPAGKHNFTVLCIAHSLCRKKTKALTDLDHSKAHLINPLCPARTGTVLYITKMNFGRVFCHKDLELLRTCVCPTLAAAVTACCAACVFPVTVSLPWCCCGSVGISAPQSWPSKMLMISAWPFSPACTSAHWPLLSTWPTWHKGVHRRTYNTGAITLCP